MHQLAYILALYLTGDHFLLQLLLAALIVWIMGKPKKPHFDPSSGVVTIYETPEETEERYRREAEKKAREMAEESTHVMAEESRLGAKSEKDEADLRDAEWQEY